MTALLHFAIVFICGAALGILQSLLVGMRAKRWEGGTGILWGLIIGLLSGISTLWLDWHGFTVAIALATVVLVLSLISISRGKRG